MPKGRKTPRHSLEKELETLGSLSMDPFSEEGKKKLCTALQSKQSRVAARAAKLIKENQLDGFEQNLKQTFLRFLQNPIKTDPGCHAKLAAIEALDFADYDDDETFLLAARHVQKEPAWGPPIDTAPSLRARAVLALERSNYTDILLLIAECLNDPESPARQAAVQALIQRGERNGASLLFLKLQTGDPDSLVTLGCMRGFLSLAPDWALPILQNFLSGEETMLRELAAISLGESGSDDALLLLLEHLESPLSTERKIILQALGLHRSKSALRVLLEVISGGSVKDAKAAVQALEARHFEPGIKEQVEEAAQKNKSVDLKKIILQIFPSE